MEIITFLYIKKNYCEYCNKCKHVFWCYLTFHSQSVPCLSLLWGNKVFAFIFKHSKHFVFRYFSLSVFVYLRLDNIKPVVIIIKKIRYWVFQAVADFLIVVILGFSLWLLYEELRAVKLFLIKFSGLYRFFVICVFAKEWFYVSASGTVVWKSPTLREQGNQRRRKKSFRFHGVATRKIIRILNGQWLKNL